MASLNEDIQHENQGVITEEVKSVKGTGLCVFCGKIFSRTSNLYAHHKSCKLNNTRRYSENIKTVESTGPLLCMYCGKAYSFRSGLVRHEQFCNQNDHPVYKCQICFSTFSRFDNLTSHARKCSALDANPRTGRSRVSRRSQCMYEACFAAFFHKKQLAIHLKRVHGSQIEDEQHFSFKSIDEFMNWKRTEEEGTHSCFTKHTGTKGNTAYYHCQHDGSSRPHCKTGDLPRKTDRRVKKGLVKQDKLCLARITVKTLDDGSCRVTYQPTHSHKLNITNFHRSPLLTETVKFLNYRLGLGIAPKDCFKDLSDGSFYKDLGASVISLQESKPLFLSNADALQRSKIMKIKNDKDDSISVMIRTALLVKEDPNCILLYKPIGAGKVIGPSEIDKLPKTKDLFMLGIQTKEQRSMMLSGAKIILSINITNEANVYGYPLLTLAVPDEHNRGYPVGYFISSNMDYDSMFCFFLALNSNCPELADDAINCVIMPYNVAMCDAIRHGLLAKLRHIWCLWDVHWDFQHRLINFAPDYLVQNMYNCLCSMIACRDKSEFQHLIDRFIAEYSKDSTEFIAYFKERYLSTVKHWAMSYRDFYYGSIEATIFNERLHNRIEVGYPNNGHNRRLDDLISILLDLQGDDFRKKSTEEVLGVPFGVGDISICHANGLKIPDNNVSLVHELLWEITMDDDIIKTCKVVKCADQCVNEMCYFVCNSLPCKKLCSHLFACTCPDRNPLCKHIHKVQELISSQELSCMTNDNKTQILSKTLFSSVDDNRLLLDNVNNYMQQLSSLIQERKVSTELLQQIETRLVAFIDECQSAPLKQVAISEFQCEEQELAKTECISPVQDDALSVFEILNTDNSSSFTPPLHFAKLNETVLKCGIEELTFLHLKLLDPYLTLDDTYSIHDDENFHDNWMYPTVVNAFCYQLELSYGSIVAINSDIAFILARDVSINVFHMQRFLEQGIAIIPMCLSRKHWTCVAVYHEKNEMVYLSSKETISKTDKVVIENLQLMFAKKASWKVTIANYDFQKDYTGCGTQVCHFVEQIAKKVELAPLIDARGYRKHIYEAIVGGCLMRKSYNDTVCGKCNEDVCASADEETAQLMICCDKCNQWFHIYCVDLQDMDITNMQFTCPR